MDKQREADDSSGNNARAGKLEFIITSVVTVFPILIGLLLWNKLPDKMAVPERSVVSFFCFSAETSVSL